MTCRPAAVAFALALLTPSPAPAQQTTDDDVWAGNTEISAVATSGNSETRTFGLGGEVTYKPGDWTWLGRAAYVEASADKELRARSFNSLVETSRNLTVRLDVYGRGGYLRDLFAGIEHRLSTEGGLAYQVVGTDAHALRLLVGAGVTRETRLVGENLSIGTANTTGRYEWTLSETSALTEEALFVADLNTGSNWRFANEIAVIGALNTLLSVKISHKLSYLNEPVPGFRKTDTIFAAALVSTF